MIDSLGSIPPNTNILNLLFFFCIFLNMNTFKIPLKKQNNKKQTNHQANKNIRNFFYKYVSSLMFKWFYSHIKPIALSARAVEYTYCVSTDEPGPPTKRGSWIWWRGYNPGALGNMEYLFITIAPRFTLARRGSTWKDPIYGSNRTVWHLNCV